MVQITNKVRPPKPLRGIPVDNNDLASTLARDLGLQKYECMVCWEIIKANQATWSCECCWAIFHLGCIEQWAQYSLEDTTTNKYITNWRCPGCQFERRSIPVDYLCFCGKERDPNPSKYLTSHSCGQLCKKPRSCPHECLALCHPGPCALCTAAGPKITCFCGKNTMARRCKDIQLTTYECGEPCRKELNCGKHTCERTCHEGPCGPCEVEQVQTCHCEKSIRLIYCTKENQPFKCDHLCSRPFSCGNHTCQLECHPIEHHDSTCPTDIHKITTCPCGKMEVNNRQTCTDEIPLCDSICNKRIDGCEHRCMQTCHKGPCPPCTQVATMQCKCGREKGTVLCSEKHSGYQCDRPCKQMLDCGRHKCFALCCSLDRHQRICPETCGKVSDCGVHTCQVRCHKGACLPCPVYIMERMDCSCGKTSLFPPIKCGTPFPACPFPCERRRACGHTGLARHECHPDSEQCPPCPVLVTQTCLCGGTDVKNVPCHRTRPPQCGNLCLAKLECGHTCDKPCHQGECSEVCSSKCDGKRRCGHPCTAKCHHQTGNACPEEAICQYAKKLFCACKENHMEFICGEAPVNLDCSTYCERVKQKRIAHAMDDCVFEETDQDDNYCDDLGYYDDTIREYYRDNFRACRKIELEMLQLVKSKQQNTINFRPMKKPLRAFIHRYAKHFNLESKSVDAEPQRSVVLRKGLGACRIPPYLLHSAAYDATQNQYVNLPPSKQDPPINAFYFSGAAFGLPEDKMEYLVAQLLNSNKNENNSSIQQQQQQIRLVRMPEKDAILLISKAEQVDSDRVTLLFKQCKRELKQALPFIQVDCCHVDDKNQILWSERPNLIQPSKELKVTKKKKKQKPIKPANIFELLINEQDGPEDDDWVLLP